MGCDRTEIDINAKLKSRYVGMPFQPFPVLVFQNPIGFYRIEIYINAISTVICRYAFWPFRKVDLKIRQDAMGQKVISMLISNGDMQLCLFVYFQNSFFKMPQDPVGQKFLSMQAESLLHRYACLAISRTQFSKADRILQDRNVYQC